ncbi:hypothetical protein EBZ39_16080 [bacterium]|nr:hypothetical protein [bacterium]
MSYKGTPVVPSWVVTGSGITVANYAGLTVDKLRPTLAINDGGMAGATGVSFNGGLIISPKTTWSSGAGTNLLSWSEEFVGRWGTLGITAQAVNGPFELTTASAWTISPANYNLGGYPLGIFGIYDLTNSKSTFFVQANVSGGVVSSVSLRTITSPATASNSRVRCYEVGNGWYRIELILDPGALDANCTAVNVYAVYDGGASNTLGLTTSIWGAQLNTGNYAKQYVKTTGAAASGGAQPLHYLEGAFVLPTTPGGTFESMLTGQHLNLTRPLVLRDDMDAFFVFRNTVESAGRNTGFVNSSRALYDSFFSNNEDFIVSVRGWNTVDRDPASAYNSGNYAKTGNTFRYYPSTSSLLFRPFGAYSTSSIPSTC